VLEQQGLFFNGKLVHQLKFKLHGHCTNNKAKQIAIFKVLEKLEELQDVPENDKRVAICTDSKVIFELLQNKFKRNRLIEIIRNKTIALTHLKWTVHLAGLKGMRG
jgi:ribonuclease HI